ncbi:hypothetical protein ACT7DJ_12970 [Bacillus cereus]
MKQSLKKIERELEYLKITKRELQFQDKQHDRKKTNETINRNRCIMRKILRYVPHDN